MEENEEGGGVTGNVTPIHTCTCTFAALHIDDGWRRSGWGSRGGRGGEEGEEGEGEGEEQTTITLCFGLISNELIHVLVASVRGRTRH